MIGLAGNFNRCALEIGLYGLCQVLIYFLGMDPQTAFPIMMASCTFLMRIAARASSATRPSMRAP